MRLKTYFYEPPNKENANKQPTIDNMFMPQTQTSEECSEDERTHNKFKSKSTFDTKINDPFLEVFFFLVKEEIDNYHPKSSRGHNLTKEEREALHSLQSNINLTIKKADKGSAVVLMDTEQYIQEAERQLNDTDFYVKSITDPTDNDIKQIEEILKEMLNKLEIEWETYTHLKPDMSKNGTANFYFLPKIHKKVVTGRPIISSNGCPTAKISAFVNNHIKGFVKELPSYVKDNRFQE